MSKVFIAVLGFMFLTAGYGAAQENLLIAIESGDRQKVNEAISAGADANSSDLLGITALMYAIISDNPDIIKSVINAGAKINTTDIVGTTALILASDLGSQAETILTLIDAGARINVKDNSGWTSLLVAARSGHDDLVELLLDHGADRNVVTQSGISFFLAASSGGLGNQVMELLRGEVDVNQYAEDKLTALMYFSKAGQENVVNRLIAKKAGVNMKDKYGNSVLAYAMVGGHEKVILALKKAGAMASFGRGDDNVFCLQVREDIANLAIANEGYFAENGEYIVDIKNRGQLLWAPSKGMKFSLGGKTEDKFTALATHPRCVNRDKRKIIYIWDSSRGGLQ